MACGQPAQRLHGVSRWASPIPGSRRSGGGRAGPGRWCCPAWAPLAMPWPACARQGLEAPSSPPSATACPFWASAWGMQLLFEVSEEMGEHRGLGILPGGCTRFPTPGCGCPIWAGTRSIRRMPDAAVAAACPMAAMPTLCTRITAMPPRSRGDRGTTDYGLDLHVSAVRATTCCHPIPPGKEPGRRRAHPAQLCAALPASGVGGRGIMIIYPAIDLRGGRCVRLRAGRFCQPRTVFADDPVPAMAQRWVSGRRRMAASGEPGRGAGRGWGIRRHGWRRQPGRALDRILAAVRCAGAVWRRRCAQPRRCGPSADAMGVSARDLGTVAVREPARWWRGPRSLRPEPSLRGH
jgi:hypothetical protein